LTPAEAIADQCCKNKTTVVPEYCVADSGQVPSETFGTQQLDLEGGGISHNIFKIHRGQEQHIPANAANFWWDITRLHVA
jgi:hypothetical protein